ncbi:hypothetical protein [Aureimonas leprariae]|uniref:Uncharacterized protein n=1 Tax=Plantimonas leprariae TaxID=2615207 RepID=A0A7V7PSK8_9HYPH|nr:hypothetical protein [Aureimonas leprariae]KAB0682535.1 hypothetical protein F6X38_00115 [Aureimonas leprariae]
MSKHLKAGSPGAVKPQDDLDRNPGINSSKGMTMAGADPEDIQGNATFEGDVENDVNAQGGIDPKQTGRTNK